MNEFIVGLVEAALKDQELQRERDERERRWREEERKRERQRERIRQLDEWLTAWRPRSRSRHSSCVRWLASVRTTTDRRVR